MNKEQPEEGEDEGEEEGGQEIFSLSDSGPVNPRVVINREIPEIFVRAFPPSSFFPRILILHL